MDSVPLRSVACVCGRCAARVESTLFSPTQHRSSHTPGHSACVLTLVAFILSCDPAHVPARGGAGGDCRTGVRGHTRALCTLDRLERGTGWTAQGTGSRDTGHKVRTATRTIRRDIYLCRTSHHETDTFSHTQRAERQAAGHRTPVTAPHESNTQRTPTGRQRRRGTAKHTHLRHNTSHLRTTWRPLQALGTPP